MTESQADPAAVGHPDTPLEFGPALPVATHDRLGELAETYGLDGRVMASLATLLRALAADPRAPTTIRDPAVGVDHHIADALVGLDVEAVRGARTAADLGTGAGIPGLVLASACPDCEWRLIDSVTRKTAFIARAAAAMSLENVHPVNLRTEEWREGRDANDVLTARAVAEAPVVLEYAAPLLRLGGSLVDWRTRMSDVEQADALAAAGELGLERAESRPVTPFPDAHSRFLYLYVKVRPTPGRYPRRAGTARKRPLGASTRG